MAPPALCPWFPHLTNPPGEYHHQHNEVTPNTDDGDVLAKRPGERRHGRLWSDVIHDEPPDSGGNPPNCAPQGLAAKNVGGGWWSGKDSNSRQSCYNLARFSIFSRVLASEKPAIEAFFRLDFCAQGSGTVVRSRNGTGPALRPPGPGSYSCRAWGGGRPRKGRGPRRRTTP